MQMFAPQSVHLLIAEYLDAESHIALSADWKLPTSFDKQVFTHPLLEVEHSARFVVNLLPCTMTKQYYKNKIFSATITYTNREVCISYHMNKIRGAVYLYHDRYYSVHNIDNAAHTVEIILDGIKETELYINGVYQTAAMIYDRMFKN